MNPVILRALQWIGSSFDTKTSGGASARKLTAFWFTLLTAIIEVWWLIFAVKHDKWEDLAMVLWFNGSMIGAGLGMVVYENLKKKPDAPVDPLPPNP